jgi:hypothetical protein
VEELKLVVAAGDVHRCHCPVQVTVFNMPSAMDLSGMMVDDAGGREPCQVEREGDHYRLWWIIEDLPAGQERAYTLDCATTPTAAGVELNQSEHQVDISVGGHLFTSYHYQPTVPKPYLYPVIGPGGVRMTRGYSIEEIPGETTDHKHHRSIWVGHGEVGGADVWEEHGEPPYARTAHREFEVVESGPVFGRLRAKNDWLRADDTKVCEETRDLRVYALGPDLQVFDLEVVFQATEGPVHFGDTKEAGILSIRVATSMDGNKGGRIENSEGGVSEKECWGKPAAWCDYAGTVHDHRVGFAVMDHPSSFRHPTHWHVRDYGLFTANCFGYKSFYKDDSKDGSYDLPAGEDLRFSYRVYLHSGEAGDARVADRYQDFVNPPKISVKE